MWPFSRKKKAAPSLPSNEVKMTTQPIVVAPAPLSQKEWRLGQITAMFENNQKAGRRFDAVRMDEFRAEIMKLSGSLLQGGMKTRAQQYLERLKAAGVKL